jgi:hypothetical protein
MRRVLALVLVGVVSVLGVVGASPSSAVVTSLPPGSYVWLVTADHTYAFGDQTEPVTHLANSPTGNLAWVNSQTGPWVVVPTAYGIDTFDATTGVYAETYDGAAGGYKQVAAIHSFQSAGPPIIYGLRMDGEWVDVFDSDPASPVASIHLPGPASYMSPARPGFNDQILLGSVQTDGPDKLSAVINTTDNSIHYFSQGNDQIVNGAVWSPDGARAYLSSSSIDGTTGSVGTYTASSGAYSNTPIPPGHTVQQIVISPDGNKLYVATRDIASQGTYQILDTSTMTVVGSINLGSFNTFGYGSVGLEGHLYMPPGPGSLLNQVQVTSMTYGTTETRGMGNGNLPFLGALVVDLPAQIDVISGREQATYVGHTFGQPVEVVVLDGAAKPLRDQQVLFTLDNDNGFFTGWGPEALTTTDASGKASSPTVIAEAVGSVTVTATVEGLEPVSAELTVLPPPTPPSVTALSPGNGNVAVSFSEGDDHGISLPTGFMVTAYDPITQQPAGSSHGTASPITVTGLMNGKSYTFTVTANTPLGDWKSAMSPAINVGIPPTLTGTTPGGTLPAGKVGEAYRFTFTVTGAPAPTVSFDNDATPLPDGLSFDAATATISGTPTTPTTSGPVWLSFTATNAVGAADNNPTLTINPASTLNNPDPTPTPTPMPSSLSIPASPSSGPSDSLAATGTHQPHALIGAAVLLVSTGTLFLLTRRRKTTNHERLGA